MEPEVSAFDTVARVATGLEQLGLRPVLVGGMALVLLGSQRVTQDFDFVIVNPGAQIGPVVDLCYDHGLELVSRLSSAGEVTATIDNRRVRGHVLDVASPADLLRLKEIAASKRSFAGDAQDIEFLKAYTERPE